MMHQSLELLQAVITESLVTRRSFHIRRSTVRHAVLRCTA